MWKSVISGAFLLACVFGSPLESNQEHLRAKRAIVDIQNRTTCQPGAAIPVTRVNTTERLAALRAVLLNATVTGGDVKAYIIPTDDAHQSEYVSDHDKRRKWISGFSGSAGIAVVLANKAALWTDGRYHTAAEDELDCNWLLMKSGITGYPTITEFLKQELSPTDVVGADASLLPISLWKSYDDALSKGNLTFKAITKNLVDEIWTDQPPSPNSTIFVHDTKFAGKTWQNKVVDIRQKMADDDRADVLVVTDLMEVAWLYNLRADDIAYVPVFIAYATITQSELSIYLAPNRLDSTVAAHLGANSDGSCSGKPDPCVELKSYSNIFTDVQAMSDNATINKIWISELSSYGILNRVTEDKQLLQASPIALMKAIKNPTEQNGMKESHKRDAVALISFMAVLEKEIADGKDYTEISAADKLETYRTAQPNNKGLSFTTISAVGSNGAIIHYSPTKVTDKKITTSEMYLLDSGGQYLDGTTDVTRTFHFGTPTDFQKEAYTRVLLGSIDLALAVWPEGTYGRDIDAFARGPLWQYGLDYRHGTGHGIGHFLSVHEGPARIRIGYRSHEEPMFIGMFFSDEPGYYEVGEFGVRLETIVMVTEADTVKKFQGMKFMTFESVTLVPFERNLIKLELLNAKQRTWLNTYHKKCQDQIGPMLTDAAAKAWLAERTKAVPIDDYASAAAEPKLSLILILVSTIAAFFK